MPSHNTGWETTGRAPAAISIEGVDPLDDDDSPFANSAAPSTSTGGSSSTEPTGTYVTRPGDTLSSLAGKFLGSQGRFKELYEMNKHVLRSPDEVPEGVTLTVPARVPAPKNSTTTGRNARKPAAAPVGQGGTRSAINPPLPPPLLLALATPQAARKRVNRRTSKLRSCQRRSRVEQWLDVPCEPTRPPGSGAEDCSRRG